MNKKKPKIKDTRYLPLILLAALLVRLPGMFWGQEFLFGKNDQQAHYPKGFLFQMAMTAKAWQLFLAVEVVKTIPAGVELAVTRFVDIPELKSCYVLVNNCNSPFLIMHEKYYKKYVCQGLACRQRFVKWEKVQYASREFFALAQNLFRGRSVYRLVRAFPVRSFPLERTNLNWGMS